MAARTHFIVTLCTDSPIYFDEQEALTGAIKEKLRTIICTGEYDRLAHQRIKLVRVTAVDFPDTNFESLTEEN